MGYTMDRHGKHRDNVYCAFESWLGGSWEGGGIIYPCAVGYNGKILSGWNSAGCSQDWRRLEIEWVRNSRLEIETISGYGISLMLLFRSPLPFLENYFSYRKGKIMSSYRFQGNAWKQ